MDAASFETLADTEELFLRYHARLSSVHFFSSSPPLSLSLSLSGFFLSFLSALKSPEAPFLFPRGGAGAGRPGVSLAERDAEAACVRYSGDVEVAVKTRGAWRGGRGGGSVCGAD